jgi:hypothetical protein
VKGVGFRAWGLGFGVEGEGLRVEAVTLALLRRGREEGCALPKRENLRSEVPLYLGRHLDYERIFVDVGP